MPRALVVLGLGLVLLGSSCAATRASYRQRVCDGNAAYAAGVNDGVAGAPMDSGYGGGCEASELSPLRSAYRAGYLAGLEKRPPRAGPAR